MTDIVERLREMEADGLAARTQAEYTAAGEKLIRAMPELIEEIERLRRAVDDNIEAGWHALRNERDELLQAHTALVGRLHDVTAMLEAERARNHLLLRVVAAARDVVKWDWTDNDDDCVADVERLRRALVVLP
jgi:hypothetical protein